MASNAGVQATIETTSGTMTFKFFEDKAPGHVENFIKLAEDGFYDGTVFHRIITGFMIQGGCPNGDGRGGPGYSIKAEFNDVPHVRGIMSMARSSDPDSAGSQFFVCHGEAAFLDGQYTAFAELVEGSDTLDKIADSPVKAGAGGENSTPLEPVRVTRVSVQHPA